jgi:2'-5' RNA ligase
VRLFFALWPSRRVAAELSAAAESVSLIAGGRRVGKEAIHLTLAFLGDVKQPRVANAETAARRVKFSRFTFRVENLGVWKHHSLVWAGPASPSAELQALAGELAEALAEAGFELERRRFAAHVTLVRNANVNTALPWNHSVEWPVSEFVLVRSRPGGGGSKYEILGRFAAKD